MKEMERFTCQVAAKDAAWPVLPVILADLDTGEMIYVSAQASALFGYEPAELEGEPIEILVPEEMQASHAKLRETNPDALAHRSMNVGRNVCGRRKDGSLFSLHVGITSVLAQGRRIGLAYVIDLTGVIFNTMLSVNPG